MRPLTGPYRAGAYNVGKYRKCDDCRVMVERVTGRYVPISRTHQVWCCESCAERRESIARLESQSAPQCEVPA